MQIDGYGGLESQSEDDQPQVCSFRAPPSLGDFQPKLLAIALCLIQRGQLVGLANACFYSPFEQIDKCGYANYHVSF